MSLSLVFWFKATYGVHFACETAEKCKLKMYRGIVSHII